MNRVAGEVFRCGVAAFLLATSCASAQPLTPIPPPATAAPDTVLADTASPTLSRADTARVVRHHFNHREQIITGSAIMTTLGVMMVLMNNYNPR